jgi:hypothetical protein
MKNLCVVLSCLLVLIASGCQYQADKEPSKPAQDANSAITSGSASGPDKKINPASSGVTSGPVQSEAASTAFSGFTEDEIAEAKKAAEEYYKNTVFKNIIIEYDLSNLVYKQNASKYLPENLISFKVTVVNSENPPRAIALIRSDKAGSWQVIAEGY